MSGRGDGCRNGNRISSHPRHKRKRNCPPPSNSDDGEEEEEEEEEDEHNGCCCWWNIVLFLIVLLLAFLSYYWCNKSSHLDANLALCSIGAKISTGKTKLCGPKDRINDPLSIISGKVVLPGDALCYEGIGEFYIRLPAPAIVSAISYEHVSKQAHPDGHIQSAPNTFLVFGLTTDSSNSGRHSEIYLGKFEYLDNGYPLQSFILKNPEEMEYSEIKINIVSNHGPDFTCVYRFQVHGREKKVKSCENKRDKYAREYNV